MLVDNKMSTLMYIICTFGTRWIFSQLFIYLFVHLSNFFHPTAASSFCKLAHCCVPEKPFTITQVIETFGIKLEIEVQ